MAAILVKQRRIEVLVEQGQSSAADGGTKPPPPQVALPDKLETSAFGADLEDPGESVALLFHRFEEVEQTPGGGNLQAALPASAAASRQLSHRW
ncbi:MAG: hypothetical protein IPG04_41675 [Polyangiaceae bacterium]|nr:hypothetical protein [Polyangiaceae bacterium]